MLELEGGQSQVKMAKWTIVPRKVTVTDLNVWIIVVYGRRFPKWNWIRAIERGVVQSVSVMVLVTLIRGCCYCGGNR